jgi:hypothetical protein
MSLLVGGLVGEEDVVQISTSARASLGNACFGGACARIGALVHQVGLVSAAHTLVADVRIFPVMTAIGPAMALQYAWWSRRRGPERTTRDYLAAEPTTGLDKRESIAARATSAV